MTPFLKLDRTVDSFHARPKTGPFLWPERRLGLWPRPTPEKTGPFLWPERPIRPPGRTQQTTKPQNNARAPGSACKVPLLLGGPEGGPEAAREKSRQSDRVSKRVSYRDKDFLKSCFAEHSQLKAKNGPFLWRGRSPDLWSRPVRAAREKSRQSDRVPKKGSKGRGSGRQHSLVRGLV